VSTVNSSLRVLRRILWLVVDWNVLQSAPKVKKLPGERHREHVVSFEEEPRTSRDICGEARAQERAKSPHKIIRKESYVECSCGYQGPALNGAGRKCGAEIPLSFEELLTPRVF